MSFINGARSKSNLIGSTNYYYSRAFQSIQNNLSLQSLGTNDHNSKKSGRNTNRSVLGLNNATIVRYASFGSIPKSTSSPSVVSRENFTGGSIKQMAQNTRFLANNAGSDADFRGGKPTLEYARSMPKTFAAMSNEQVLHFAMLEVPEACRECVVRDIMVVDDIEYDEAMKVFQEIAIANRRDMVFAKIPFEVGFGVAFTGGIASIPLVFDLQTVAWFNDAFVTSELPGPEDLETWLEVGAASWGWMEPVLGQVSFFLLCMQFARAQLQNLGIRPYFNWQRDHRARALCRKFPQYDAEFLTMYSKSDRLAGAHEMSK